MKCIQYIIYKVDSLSSLYSFATAVWRAVNKVSSIIFLIRLKSNYINDIAHNIYSINMDKVMFKGHHYRDNEFE